MTSPTTSLFKDQLNHFLQKLASARELESPDKALPFWYLETFLAYSQSESEDAVTEGFNDLGIDAIVISADEDSVTFYQFKNPVSVTKGIASGDVDKVISGLEIILQRKQSKLANQELKERITEIHQRLRRSYEVVFVSTGGGLPADGKTKLDALCDRWTSAGTRLLNYREVNVDRLQEIYYAKTVPTLDQTVELEYPERPYAVRIGSHRSFIFHMPCKDAADLYVRFGEKLLQQNIRTFEGEGAETNAAITRSCVGASAENFFHFNNGITILCDRCDDDAFNRRLSLLRPQIVNGGQTVRVLARALKDKRLRHEASVILRIITTDGDREFAGNVAVNLNNQTLVKSSFLRSNHPAVIQLAATLQTRGYYLERREGELDEMSDSERAALQAAVGKPLGESTVALQQAFQAYVAFFDQNLDIAKKHPKRIFLPVAAGGAFEEIIQKELSADRFLLSWRLYRKAMELKRLISETRRKRKAGGKATRIYRAAFPEYLSFLGGAFSYADLESAAPQCPLFVLAALGRIHASAPIERLASGIEELEAQVPSILFQAVALRRKKQVASSWPTLLKSQQFFETIVPALTVKALKAESLKKKSARGGSAAKKASPAPTKRSKAGALAATA